MAEVAFAKQFLTSLDTRPQKLPSDYVADPKSLPAQPAFILPRMRKPFPRSSKSTSQDPSGAGSNAGAATLRVTLSPLRQTPTSPAPVVVQVSTRSSIYELKTLLAARTGYSAEKLKILWERKPVTDSKTVGETTGASSGAVDMGVMYVGAPTQAPQPEASAAQPISPPAAQGASKGTTEASSPPVAQGQSGAEVLETGEFWDDLKGFLTQRVRDESVAQEAVTLWQKSWKAR